MSIFSRQRKQPARRSSRPLRLEPLEGRLQMATLSVVPLGTVADGVSSFYRVADALTSPALANGDTIQIEAGAVPGTINGASLPSKLNLTIQGNSAVPLDEFQQLSLNNIDINNTAAGLTFRHLYLVNVADTLNVNTNVTFDSVKFENYYLGTGISFNATTSAKVLNSYFTDYNPSTTVSTLPFILVAPGSGASNVFTGNQIASTLPHSLMGYTAMAMTTTTDVIAANVFTGTAGNSGAAGLFSVGGNINGLTIRDNTFFDADNASAGLFISDANLNLNITRNLFSFPNDDNVTGLSISSGATGVSATITGNRFDTALGGDGLYVTTGSGPANLKIEGNDFGQNEIGVHIVGSNVDNIDLGGGTQGSLGGNNFRGFTAIANTTSAGAMVVTSGMGKTVAAKFNLFSVANPERVIYDVTESATAANVDASQKLDGNAAFVQALYVRFLRRAGDLNSATDAGKWVTQLDSSTKTPKQVATAIIRSKPALRLVVNELYFSIAHRQISAKLRNQTVNKIRSGKLTLEGLLAKLYVSKGYADTHASSTNFVAGIYADLLGRTPTSAELKQQVKAVDQNGRRGVVNQLLTGSEFRKRIIRNYIRDFYHRRTSPTSAEVNALASTSLKLLDIQIRLASAAEFKTRG